MEREKERVSLLATLFLDISDQRENLSMAVANEEGDWGGGARASGAWLQGVSKRLSQDGDGGMTLVAAAI